MDLKVLSNKELVEEMIEGLNVIGSHLRDKHPSLDYGRGEGVGYLHAADYLEQFRAELLRRMQPTVLRFRIKTNPYEDDGSGGDPDFRQGNLYLIWTDQDGDEHCQRMLECSGHLTKRFPNMPPLLDVLRGRGLQIAASLNLTAEFVEETDNGSSM